MKVVTLQGNRPIGVILDETLKARTKKERRRINMLNGALTPKWHDRRGGIFIHQFRHQMRRNGMSL